MKSNKKVRQRESFNILLSNWSRVKELTEESANAAGTADKKYTAYMESMEAATKRLQNAWEGLSQSFELSPVIKGVTNLAAGLTENLVPALKILIPLIAAKQAGGIFAAIQNPGETGGLRGLLGNIPIIGERFRTNTTLEEINKNVKTIKDQKIKEDKITKNGGIFKNLKEKFKAYKKGDLAVLDERDKEQIEFIKASYDYDEDSYGDAVVKYKKAKQKKELAKAFGQVAVVSGITTLLTQLSTNKTVQGYGQSIQETSNDKALRVGLATAGSVAGAASALIPVIGPAIAPIISSLGSLAGEGIAGLLSKWFHKDELQMKQRVQDAKENLNALNNIRSTLENNADILSKDKYESSDYKKLEDFADSLRNIFKENENLRKSFLEDINSINIGKFTTIEEVLQKIKDGNVEINKAVSRQLKLTTARLKVENTLSSQEEKRKEINERRQKEALKIQNRKNPLYEKLEKDGLLKIEKQKPLTLADTPTYNVRLSGNTIDKQFESAKKVLDKVRLEGNADIIQKWEEIVADYQTEVNKLYKVNSELLEQQVNYAVLSTDIINNYSRDQLREMGMEGVVDLIRDELISQGVAVTDEKGRLHKDAYNAIVNQIRKDSTLFDYINKDVRSIGVLIDKNDVKGIEDFARAFGITTEKAKELGKQFGYLSQSMGLMNVEEVTEYYEKLGNVLSSLGSSAALSATEINKLLSDSQLKDLLPYLMDQENPDALLKELYKRIYGGGQDFHMENALYDATMNLSSDAFREFLQKDSTMQDFINEIDKGGLSNLGAIRDYIKALDESDPKRKKFLEYLETINYTYEKDLGALEKPSDYIKTQLEEQIENLQAQKDALSQINDEREKELNLIKARAALEDARKEKRRVYRQGVGFVMEANEEAIAEAQKNIENLNVQKRQEDMQTEIDRLQVLKGIVEALPNQKEREQTRKMWELWAADKNTKGSLASVTESVSLLADAYNDAVIQMNLRKHTEGVLNAPKEGKDRDLSEERTDPTKELSDPEIRKTQDILSSIDENVEKIIKKSFPENAAGSLSFSGGKTLVNELGTEAIITPGGTLTALPSRTGIVPADITRNVWALGEIAPTLVARLGSLTQKAPSGNVGNTTYEEGQYFDNFTMNVYPAKGDDFNKILEQARAQVRLTRHNN